MRISDWSSDVCSSDLTEYGIADLRGRNDEACIRAMLAVSDARFQPALARSAIAAAKLAGDWLPAPDSQCNTPAHIAGLLAPFRASGDLPDYPLGCDFTVVEQRLAKALGWLKRHTATPKRKFATIAGALITRSEEHTSELQPLMRISYAV